MLPDGTYDVIVVDAETGDDGVPGTLRVRDGQPVFRPETA